MNTNRIYYSKEAEQMAHRQSRVKSLALLSLGAGLGATITLLLAPNDGEKAREMVADALEEGFTRGRDAAGQALRQLSSEYPDLREQVSKVLNGLKS